MCAVLHRDVLDMRDSESMIRVASYHRRKRKTKQKKKQTAETYSTNEQNETNSKITYDRFGAGNHDQFKL